MMLLAELTRLAICSRLSCRRGGCGLEPVLGDRAAALCLGDPAGDDRRVGSGFEGVTGKIVRKDSFWKIRAT